MATIHIRVETLVEESLPLVKSNFNEDLFKALSPAFPIVRLVKYEGDKMGGMVHVELDLGLTKWNWISTIKDMGISENSWYFVDEGIELPPFLSAWKHTHLLEATTIDTTTIVDQIECRAGKYWPDFLVRILVERQMIARSPIYQKKFNTG